MSFLLSIIAGIISSVATVLFLFKWGGVRLGFDEKLKTEQETVLIDIRNVSCFQKAYDLEVTVIGKLRDKDAAYKELDTRRNRFAFLSRYAQTGKKWYVIVEQSHDTLKSDYSHLEIFVRAKSGWFGIENLSQKTYILE